MGRTWKEKKKKIKKMLQQASPPAEEKPHLALNINTIYQPWKLIEDKLGPSHTNDYKIRLVY
jgi:hypothetical protein